MTNTPDCGRVYLITFSNFLFHFLAYVTLLFSPFSATFIVSLLTRTRFPPLFSFSCLNLVYCKYICLYLILYPLPSLSLSMSLSLSLSLARSFFIKTVLPFVLLDQPLPVTTVLFHPRLLPTHVLRYSCSF